MADSKHLLNEIEKLPLKEVKVLEVLIRNIHEHPGEEKYRKVKLTNHSFKLIWDHQECREFLHQLGFITRCDEFEVAYLIFPAEAPTEHLPAARQELSKLLERKSLQSTPSSPSSATVAPHTLSSSGISPSTADISGASYFESVNDEGQTQMHIAAAIGNVPMITYLLTIAPEMVRNCWYTNSWSKC
jgi:hypothetical protein